MSKTFKKKMDRAMKQAAENKQLVKVVKTKVADLAYPGHADINPAMIPRLPLHSYPQGSTTKKKKSYYKPFGSTANVRNQTHRFEKQLAQNRLNDIKRIKAKLAAAGIVTKVPLAPHLRGKKGMKFIPVRYENARANAKHGYLRVRMNNDMSMTFISRSLVAHLTIGSAVGDVQVPPKVGDVVYTSAINPNLVGGQRLKRQTSLWGKFTVHKMTFDFQHVLGTQNSGNIVGAFSMDPAEYIPANSTGVEELQSKPSAKTTSLFEPCTWSFSEKQKRGDIKRYFVNPQGSDTADIRQSNFARFNIAVNTPPTSTDDITYPLNIGTLWAEMHVTFYDPEINPYPGTESIWAPTIEREVPFTTTITNFYPLTNLFQPDEMVFTEDSSGGVEYVPLTAPIPGTYNSFYLPPGEWLVSFRIKQAYTSTGVINFLPTGRLFYNGTWHTIPDTTYDYNGSRSGFILVGTTPGVYNSIFTWELIIPNDNQDYFFAPSLSCDTATSGTNLVGAYLPTTRPDCYVRFKLVEPAGYLDNLINPTLAVSKYKVQPTEIAVRVQQLENALQSLRSFSKDELLAPKESKNDSKSSSSINDQESDDELFETCSPVVKLRQQQLASFPKTPHNSLKGNEESKEPKKSSSK